MSLVCRSAICLSLADQAEDKLRLVRYVIARQSQSVLEHSTSRQHVYGEHITLNGAITSELVAKLVLHVLDSAHQTHIESYRLEIARQASLH